MIYLNVCDDAHERVYDFFGKVHWKRKILEKVHWNSHCLPTSRRPKKTTQLEVLYLVTSSRRNRFLTSTTLAACLQASTGTRVSFGTFRNRLRAAALKSRRPLVGVPLTHHHRRARLNWAGHTSSGQDSNGSGWCSPMNQDSIFRQLTEDFGSAG